MIYMVEIAFGSAAHEDEWNAWYSAHLHTLLSVPGFETAQRFEAPPETPRRYMACYTVTAPGVFTSPGYAAIGGGGIASARWKAFINRRRTLFDGIDRVPELKPDHCLILADAPHTPPDLPNILFVPLRPAALDMQPAQRAIAVTSVAEAEHQALDARPDVTVYRPRGAWVTTSAAKAPA